ncbi:MAG: hypothetical protein LBG75_01155 [Candidatus Nomurabacteria bacterium]|jgi:hypothetical protein|nr:hypothetical protein [Candidatus Nomurabacteria bacterium]
MKKLPQPFIVALNTVSLSLAGVLSVFSVLTAAANFTKGEWLFTSPYFNGLTNIPLTLVLSVAAVLFAVIATITLKKITDADILKKAYSIVAVVAITATVIALSAALSAVLLSLLTVGVEGNDQGAIWLSGFLPAMIVAVITTGLALLAKAVACGKISILPVVTYAVLGIASFSLLLWIISDLVYLYSDNDASEYSRLKDRLYEYKDSF